MGINCMALNRKTIPDDIDSLCTHLGLDPAAYHHFSNDAAPLGTASPVHPAENAMLDKAVLPNAAPVRSPEAQSPLSSGITEAQKAPPAAPAGPAQAHPEPVVLQSSVPALLPVDAKRLPSNALPRAVADIRGKLHVLGSLSANLSTVPTPASPINPTHPPATRWPSLRGIGGSLAKSAGLNASPVAFHGVGGGVGLTTVLATTAKALAMLGQRVLVADDSPRSTLPYFFGAHDLLGGSNSLIVSDGVPTYLLLRDPLLEADTTDEWLWRKAAQLDRSIDALLMEASPQMASRTQTWVCSAGISIFVLEPDMRSAMALPKTVELLAARQARFAEPAATYFLLNKYDETSPFNVDMRSWLQDELEGMLAPVVLRRDNRVSEALANEKTVLDYAPASEIATDFHMFAQWLRSIWKR
jgi:cellulose biosynthesis protein BcsQ